MKMQGKTNFYLVDCHTGELLESGTDYQKVIEIPKSVAEAHNCGLVRCWFEPEEKRLYIDAGPVVYYVIADTNEGYDSLLDLFFGGKEQC